MKMLGEIFQKFEVKCHQYADETQLYISLPFTAGDIVDTLNQHLESEKGWL